MGAGENRPLEPGRKKSVAGGRRSARGGAEVAYRWAGCSLM